MTKCTDVEAASASSKKVRFRLDELDQVKP